MTRLRWTTALFLVGGISAILLHFISKVEGFPKEVMLVFRPADYVRQELQSEVGGGILGKIIGNVAFFGMLAAVQGALIGLILDLYKSSQRLALDQRVKHLRRGTDKIDLALRRRVLEILTKYDPAGLIKLGSAKDAYTSQADMILARMNKLRSPQSLRKFCRQRFRRELGRQAGKFKEYDSLAKEIWTAYRQQLSLGKREAPVSKGL